MHRGSQRPRIEHVPPRASTAGPDVVEFAASAGLFLDPWQRHVLEGALGERADGQWSAFEVGLIVSRQNGKGAVLEALVLAWLFLFDERQVLFSAHELKTALEMYKRIRDLIRGTPDLDRQVAHFYASNEKTSIELHDGREVRFVARSKGSGRGFSADKIVFDEAYNLPDESVDALMPTVGARPNPQIWYTSSAGDKDIAPCDVLARVRRRGLRGEDDGLAFFEWSVDYDEQGRVKGDPADPRLWAMANPSMGIRKTQERISKFHASMSPEGFAREELSVGNWPVDDSREWVVPREVWAALADPAGKVKSRPVFAVEMSADRKRVAVGVAGGREDGRIQCEVAHYRDGTAWVADVVAQMQSRHNADVVVDAKSPAFALVEDLESAGVTVTLATLTDVVEACGQFLDDCQPDKDRIRHLSDPVLATALQVASMRPLGGAQAFDRMKSAGDISPLFAVALAAHRYRATLGADYDVLDSIG